VSIVGGICDGIHQDRGKGTTKIAPSLPQKKMENECEILIILK
jgi:hypothetical protein